MVRRHKRSTTVVVVCLTALASAVAWRAWASSRASRSPKAGVLLVADDFSQPRGPNHLITNEWAYWNRTQRHGVTSPTWQMTSGSLFSVDGVGWTGPPDDIPPDQHSRVHTDSQIFRLHTSRADFRDVVQAVDVRINRYQGSAQYPRQPSDGVVLWPRYLSAIHLYFAYVLPEDGSAAITKKCPGAVAGGSYYNGGTYFDLTGKMHPGRVARGRWYRIASSVQDNADGSVTIRAFRDGHLVAATTDRGIGCVPLRGPTHLGIRTDNVDANFARYRAYELSPWVSVTCPDALVGSERRRSRSGHPVSRSRACPRGLNTQPRP
jgi:hypothetical protein